MPKKHSHHSTHEENALEASNADEPRRHGSHHSVNSDEHHSSTPEAHQSTTKRSSKRRRRSDDAHGEEIAEEVHSEPPPGGGLEMRPIVPSASSVVLPQPNVLDEYYKGRHFTRNMVIIFLITALGVALLLSRFANTSTKI